MQQQEGIHDDNQHDVQLYRSNHKEVGHDGAGHDYEEDFDQEEDGRRCLTVCFSFSHSINCQVRGSRPLSITSRRGCI